MCGRAADWPSVRVRAARAVMKRVESEAYVNDDVREAWQYTGTR